MFVLLLRNVNVISSNVDFHSIRVRVFPHFNVERDGMSIHSLKTQTIPIVCLHFFTFMRLFQVSKRYIDSGNKSLFKFEKRSVQNKVLLKNKVLHLNHPSNFNLTDQINCHFILIIKRRAF